MAAQAQNSLRFRDYCRNRLLYSCPKDFRISFEVIMGQHVSGGVRLLSFKCGEISDNFGVCFDCPICCFSNCFNATANGILGLFLAEKLIAGHLRDVACGTIAPVDDVFQELIDRPACFHNGLRSSAILPAKPVRSAPGVATSTGIPSSASSSSFNPARSNSVVASVGSTSRSRSLPS